MNSRHKSRLNHDRPSFVSDGATYFLTLCATPRGLNQLAHDTRWEIIQSAAAHYHRELRWHVRLLLAMPDHVHMLASFPRNIAMRQVIIAWKHFTSHQGGIFWQRDFFDHRLRNAESLDEKAHYIRQNPLRAGLISNANAWPFVWSPPDAVAMPE